MKGEKVIKNTLRPEKRQDGHCDQVPAGACGPARALYFIAHLGAKIWAARSHSRL